MKLQYKSFYPSFFALNNIEEMNKKLFKGTPISSEAVRSINNTIKVKGLNNDDYRIILTEDGRITYLKYAEAEELRENQNLIEVE